MLARPAPLYSMTPGMQVRVVNSYEAWTDSVLVMVLSRVDYSLSQGLPRLIDVRTFNDSRQIQELDVGPLILNDPRDAGQSRELVRGLDGFRLGDGAQQGGLAHGGKPDHGHSGIARLQYVEAFALFTLLPSRFQKLGAIFGELGFECAQMIFSGWKYKKRGLTLFG